jgi:hypothetical protein
MSDGELWDRIWTAWKGVLFVFLLVAAAVVLTVYLGDFLLSGVLVTTVAITVVLYKKKSDRRG